jgi:hypothetical protein
MREFGGPDDVEDVALFGEAQNEPTEEESPASDGAAEGCEDPSCGLGVSPESNVNTSIEQSSGQTPKPLKARETDANAPPEGAD